MVLEARQTPGDVIVGCAGDSPAPAGFEVAARQLQRESPDLFLSHVSAPASQLLQSLFPATSSHRSLDHTEFAFLFPGFCLQHAQSMSSGSHGCLGRNLEGRVELAGCTSPEPCVDNS